MFVRVLRLLSLCFAAFALAACASEEIAGARDLSQDKSREQAAEPAPQAKSVRPQGIKVGSAAPVRAPWRGERVRALDLDSAARSEVQDAKGRSEFAYEAGPGAARSQRAHDARAAEARRRAGHALRIVTEAEEARLRELRAIAAGARTPRHALERRAALLRAAQQAAGRDRADALLRAVHEIARRAAHRVQACGELRLEQAARVERVHRMTLAALAQGVPLPSGRAELQIEMRRLGQITLLEDEATAEALYASTLAQTLEEGWRSQ